MVRNSPSLIDIPDNYADLIYACHVLEHISHRLIHEMLINWFRVLMPGGILRISVPDFDILLSKYNESGNNLKSIILALMGGQSYEMNYHHSVFNESMLREYMVTAGFQAIQIWHPHTLDNWPHDWSWENWVSLNLEGIK